MYRSRVISPVKMGIFDPWSTCPNDFTATGPWYPKKISKLRHGTWPSYAMVQVLYF